MYPIFDDNGKDVGCNKIAVATYKKVPVCINHAEMIVRKSGGYLWINAAEHSVQRTGGSLPQISPPPSSDEKPGDSRPSSARR
jgi:hypothetical protein